MSPSINFPRQSVTDAGDIVRPFTLRGLSPDHTLVLVNGWRRHQTALVNNFTYGMGAGSSGVDLNAFPSSALDRIEVLRDGASAQYGSDAIAGVVNLVLKDGAFTPVPERRRGPLRHRRLPRRRHHRERRTAAGESRSGRGSLGLFGEFRDRQPTNRAWADAFEDAGTGVADSIDGNGQVVQKRNPVDQPNHHWGDGLEKDALTFANFRMPVNEAGRARSTASAGTATATARATATAAYSGSARNWADIYPLGFLPDIRGPGDRLFRGRRPPGTGLRLELRAGDRVRPQRFRLPHQQDSQRLPRPLSGRGLRPGRRRHPGHR